MPYLLVSTQVRMVSQPLPPSSLSCSSWEQLIIPFLTQTHLKRLKERGPTIVGDETSDPELMARLDATKVTLLGNDL